MTWSIVRGFFYVWFSAAVGLTAAYLTFLAAGSAATSRLPGGGWPVVVLWPVLILAALISTQASHFGVRVSLVKWIPICVVATIALFGAILFSG